jgi:hypothetical protein
VTVWHVAVRTDAKAAQLSILLGAMEVVWVDGVFPTTTVPAIAPAGDKSGGGGAG